eukprot:12872416-Alexandrium_andersonii.AAC.1
MRSFAWRACWSRSFWAARTPKAVPQAARRPRAPPPPPGLELGAAPRQRVEGERGHARPAERRRRLRD